MSPYLALLLVGFTEPRGSPLLLVSSYLTVSPLPLQASLERRFVFCGTFPTRPKPRGGRYPPPRPMESGRSSGAVAARGLPQRDRSGDHSDRHDLNSIIDASVEFSKRFSGFLADIAWNFVIAGTD